MLLKIRYECYCGAFEDVFLIALFSLHLQLYCYILRAIVVWKYFYKLWTRQSISIGVIRQNIVPAWIKLKWILHTCNLATFMHMHKLDTFVIPGHAGYEHSSRARAIIYMAFDWLVVGPEACIKYDTGLQCLHQWSSYMCADYGKCTLVIACIISALTITRNKLIPMGWHRLRWTLALCTSKDRCELQPL